MKHINIIFFEKLINFVTNIYITSLIYRYIEISDNLFYSQSIMALLSFFIILGMPSIYIKEKLRRGSIGKDFIGSTIFLSLIGGVMLVIVVCFIYFFSEKATQSFLMIFLLSQLIRIYEVYGYILIAYKKLHVFSFISILAKIALVTFIYYSIMFLDGQYVVYGFVIESIILIFLSGYFVKRLVNLDNIFFIKFNKKSIKNSKKLLKVSMPLIFSSILATIYIQTDTIMLKNLAEKQSVSDYVAAMKLFLPGLTFAILISNFLAPRYDINSSHLQKKSLIAKIDLILFIIAFFSICLINLISFQLSNILFNGSKEVILILSILTISWLFILRGPYISKILVIEKLEKYVFYKVALAAFINIVLNLVFIKKYGSVGAAITSVISYFISDLFFYAFFQKTRVYFLSYLIMWKKIYILKNLKKLWIFLRYN